MGTTAATARSLHIRVDSLSVEFSDRRVLTDVSFGVSAGERIGLIGENGSGKSTLLRVIAGLALPNATTAGTVSLGSSGGRDVTVGLLHQEPPFDIADSISDVLDDAVSEARKAASMVDIWAARLSDDPESPSIADEFAVALETAERLGSWDIEVRIGAALAGLGIADLQRHQRVRALSGGQRARLALVSLLLRGPDVLLLDEPTNHLDDRAIAYLRRVLLGWSGPVLFASHDRSFLDEAVTGLIDLDPSPLPAQLAGEVGEFDAGSGVGVTRHTGSYSSFLEARSAARARWERQYRDEQAALKKLRAGIGQNQQVGHEEWRPRSETRAAKKFYADRNARVVARRVNDVRSRLARLESEQIRKPVPKLRFAGIPELGASAGSEPPQDQQVKSISAESLEVVGRLAPVSFGLRAGEKLLVTGDNGVGKSTLLGVIRNEIAPTGGVLVVNAASIGLLAQAIRVQIGRDSRAEGGLAPTVAEVYRDALGAELAAETPLSSFELLHPRDEQRAADTLSLGQLRRLELAILLAKPPELLLLDEPTNHLSLPLVTALEAAIRQYSGTVVVASHDRWLRSRWAGERLDLSAPAGL